jgi:hypothetical protein
MFPENANASIPICSLKQTSYQQSGLETFAERLHFISSSRLLLQKPINSALLFSSFRSPLFLLPPPPPPPPIPPIIIVIAIRIGSHIISFRRKLICRKLSITNETEKGERERKEREEEEEKWPKCNNVNMKRRHASDKAGFGFVLCSQQLEDLMDQFDCEPGVVAGD